MKLTSEQVEVLNKIASKSKMDCWFYIEKINEVSDGIYDAESNEHISLWEGIAMLDSGITSLSDYGLTPEEMEIYYRTIFTLALNENEKCKCWLYNTLTYVDDVCGVDIENNLEEIGMSSKDYKKILQEGSDYFNG